MSLVFGLVRSELMQGETVAETESLRQYLAEAERFLRSHGWCGEIVERYFGYGVPDVLAIFLIRIRPLQPHVDEDLWVIVGDVPPAYIVTEGNDTPRDALAGYVEEMNRWVEAVERL